MAAVPQTSPLAPHRAATQVSIAGAVLAGLGLASAAFAVLRLLETWRVGGAAASHHVSILGQRLSYPTANLAAVVVLLLALIGLTVTAMTLHGAVREAAASIRFTRRIARRHPVRLGDVLVIGALAQLDARAPDAVLAHERHHARRRDPLRLAMGRVLVRALFFMPGLGRLLARQQALAELSADESAINAGPGTLVAQIVADFAAEPDRERNAAWVAELEGERVGCVFCVADDDPGVAKLRIVLVDPKALRIVLVDPKARGRGLGFRLVGTAIDFARRAGYERMRLWTNHPLTVARQVYLRHGFRLTREEPHHSFGVDLIGQTYELALRSS